MQIQTREGKLLFLRTLGLCPRLPSKATLRSGPGATLLGQQFWSRLPARCCELPCRPAAGCRLHAIQAFTQTSCICIGHRMLFFPEEMLGLGSNLVQSARSLLRAALQACSRLSACMPFRLSPRSHSFVLGTVCFCVPKRCSVWAANSIQSARSLLRAALRVCSRAFGFTSYNNSASVY